MVVRCVWIGGVEGAEEACVLGWVSDVKVEKLDADVDVECEDAEESAEEEDLNENDDDASEVFGVSQTCIAVVRIMTLVETEVRETLTSLTLSKSLTYPLSLVTSSIIASCRILSL
jgi:hypothetical protein